MVATRKKVAYLTPPNSPLQVENLVKPLRVKGVITVAEYWAHQDGMPQTYGDIMDAFETKRDSVATMVRADEKPVKTGLPVWLKLAVIVTALIVLLDKLKI